MCYNNCMIVQDFILSKTGFEQQMLSYIEKIDSGCYTYKKGGDGFAYFISDDLILKEFRVTCGAQEEYIFETYFEDYCKEIQMFSELGLSVPKIFAWCSLPTPEKRAKSSLPQFSYYILEERVRGRELYYPQVEDFYENYKNEMSLEEYQIKYKFPDRNNGIGIYQNYFNDYININRCLESMPEKEIEKFILDAYRIYVNGEFAELDLYSTNVLYDGTTLKQIDQRFNKREESKTKKVKNRSEFMLTSLVKLFIYNAQVKDYYNDIKEQFYDRNIDFGDLYHYVEMNNKECSAAMLKFLKILKKCVDGIKLPDNENLKNLRRSLVRMIGKQGAHDFLNEIQKNEM